jgi:hypothetical protein
MFLGQANYAVIRTAAERAAHPILDGPPASSKPRGGSNPRAAGR